MGESLLTLIPIYGDKLAFNEFLEMGRDNYILKNQTAVLTNTEEFRAKAEALCVTLVYKSVIYLGEGALIYKSLEHMV